MKKNKITILANLTSVFVMFLILSPFISHATSSGIANPLKSIDNIKDFVSKILEYVVKVGAYIAVFAFIYVGYLFVSARGSDSGLKTAKEAFLNTVIGVALLLGAKLVSTMIVDTIKNIE